MRCAIVKMTIYIDEAVLRRVMSAACALRGGATRLMHDEHFDAIPGLWVLAD